MTPAPPNAPTTATSLAPTVDRSPNPELLAAVDLGSNSFHLAVARVVDGALTMVDRLRERVQLGAGLGPDKLLEEAAQTRALATLARFGQRLQHTPTAAVRAVGTDTLRVAKNAREFTARAAEALGHPIEIISGDEEARLIYRGVVHDLPHEDGKRQLVMDIGGGSTEVILGVGLNHEHLTSLHLGCVSYTKKFFPDGKITRDRFKKATIAARLQFERLRGPYFRPTWDRALGSSGTIHAIQAILRDNGWADGPIEIRGLKRLRNALIDVGHADRLDLPGLKPTRAPVLAAGVAILYGAFKTLPLTGIQAASGALREGVMYDLLGRYAQQDVRETTIRNLTERFRVDDDQARRVERTATTLFGYVAPSWFPGETAVHARQCLRWGARLHEVGLAIAFHGYHKHGAYVVGNSTMPGFSEDEQRVLAALVASHRRRISRADLEAVPQSEVELVRRLAVLLRLAVHLNRNRSWRALPEVVLSADDQRLVLSFPDGFLDDNPLTRADFDEEVDRLAGAGITLIVS